MKKIFALLVAIVFVSACLGEKEIYSVKYAGTDVNFRAELTKAQKTLLEPNVSALRDLMLENPVDYVRIAFVPDENYTGFYSVAGFELQYKTIIAYKQWIFTDTAVAQREDGLDCVHFLKNVSFISVDRRICFSTLLLNSTEEAYALANDTAPIILMEAASNETKVQIGGNVARVAGKDMSQNNRRYTDLDLAADKFLLVLMNESLSLR